MVCFSLFTLTLLTLLILGVVLFIQDIAAQADAQRMFEDELRNHAFQLGDQASLMFGAAINFEGKTYCGQDSQLRRGTE